MRLLLSALLMGALFGGAEAQSAPLTERRFIDLLDARLARDGLDSVRSCRKESGETYACTFDDTEYRTTLKHGDDTGKSSGEHHSPTSMTVGLAGDVVDSINLLGDRGRPASLLNFTAHLESILHVIGPEKSDYDIEQDTLNLGVMRGDSDEDIGKEHAIAEPYATIHCLNQRLDVSAGIACMAKVKHAG